MPKKHINRNTIGRISAQPRLHQRAGAIQSYGTVNHALPLELEDKHHDEQDELVDVIAERVQLLGGVSLAMAADVAETTQIERPPRGREEPPVQLSRLVDAHRVIVRQVRTLAKRASVLGDDGTNDLVVSEVLRTNELQLWFLSEHLVNVPLVRAQEPSSDAGPA
jgi:starvation-inducible DNA-binding protein